MNKIKQNKITFTFILTAIVIIFSSLIILSLPVLFDYKSKVTIIEKNFYKNFKIYLKSSGKISYKPFPKPHLLVENATINLKKPPVKDNLIKISNLKIFISLKDLYLRSFSDFVSTKLSDVNIELKINDIKELRKHFYQKINKPIILNNAKIFLKNAKDEVILISPTKKITYKINNKSKIKYFNIDGKIFGLNFNSEWKRKYDTPNMSFHNINIFNPNIEVQNILKFKSNQKFEGQSQIKYAQNKLEYKYTFDNNNINISSPNKKKINFSLDSKIQLKPFYFNGGLIIKNKKVENIIDNFLLNLLLYNEDYIGNFNGKLKIKFNELNNKLIKKGELDLIINEKKIHLDKAKFKLDEIGYLETNLFFLEKQGDLKFISNNQLYVENHIEFAKTFQVGSKKIKHIKKIYFDLEKKIGETDFIVTNIRINKKDNKINSNETYIVKNIQNLRSHIREIID